MSLSLEEQHVENPVGRISYHVDGCSFTALSDETRKTLTRVGAYRDDDGLKSVSFSGFLNSPSGLVVFLPKTTNLGLPPDALREYSRVVFKALIRFRRQNAASLVGDSGFLADDLIGVTQISLQIELITDWLTHGVYKSSEKRSRLALNGRIDWGATIRQIDPFVSKKRLVYPSFVVSESREHSRTLIARIHSWVIAQCDRTIGWLISADGSARAVPELTRVPVTLPCTAEAAIRSLRAELQTQYNSRKVLLLKSLITFIQQANKIDGSANVFGSLKFWRVWETVCKSIVDNSYDTLKLNLPQPLYTGPDFRSAAARQIPDMLVLRDDKIIVIDAKYYDISKTLPGWGDIVKQFFYAKTLGHIKSTYKLANCFLFPMPTQALQSPTKVILMAKGPSSERLKESLNKEFPPIKCLYIDIYSAMRFYLNGDKIDVVAA